jgi:hypothetical protein
MRLALRALAFAAGLLIGGEALRRWLERQEAEGPPTAARHLRSVPATAPPTPSPSPTPTPAPATTAPKPDPAAPAPRAARDTAKASKAELYERAQKLGVKGRSKMNKAELADAVARAEGRRA